MSRTPALHAAAVVAVVAVLTTTPGFARAQSTVVFVTGFESGLPAEFNAPGSVIEPVQGYAGLGPIGNAFGGSFLRYTLQGIVDTRLTLRGLPAHTSVDLGFLLGIIDSWDGTELFKVAVDGTGLFSHSFQIATGDTSSYLAPPGGLLSRGVNLGFSNGSYYARDRAYDLAIEPAFIGIPHSADTLEVRWSLGAISGGAAAQWQGGSDESWALDHVRVTVHGSPVGVAPPPGALALAAPLPNPAPRSGFLARFTLTTDAPAMLELFDARGRRLAARDVGDLGPGAHAIELTPRSIAAPGVGFLRLTQDGAIRVARVVLLP